MPGSTEILIILALGAIIFFILPMVRKAPQKKTVSPRPVSGMARLSIVASVLWPLLLAVIIEPWKGDVDKFIYFGVAPVVISWALGWVVVGFKRGA